ncbi:MAG TPA: Gfo/Idh/MocA family oxidoreductase [Acidimicrobiia bacterium]|nr:Gfo/Idh/MocA family oxidoreductase [Acidimicrobiia bacterium]
MTVRVGIVGCGHIGFIHSYTLHQLIKHQLVDACVTATYDTDPERAAAFALAHGAVACDGLDALLDRVDVVWICTWTAAHHAVVAAAVARGHAVFCEKPLAPTLPACEAVAAMLATVPHQVGLVLRHVPVFQALVSEVRSGRHGRPLAVVFRDDQYFPVQGAYASEWRADVTRAGGGTLFEHSIHDVDVLRWLLGDPVRVRADVTSRYQHPGIDDVAALTLTFGDDSVATLTSVWHQILSRGSARRVEVFCDDALLWLDDDAAGPLHLETSDRSETIATDPPAWVTGMAGSEPLVRLIGEYAPATKTFLDALAADGPAAVGFPDAATALAAHRVVAAAYQSAAAGGEAITPRPR